MKNSILILAAISLLISCSPSPSPIEYGSDLCDFCMMTIVDKKHGAELVSSKGKVFKFDAIECMVHFEAERKDKEYAFKLVNDFPSNGKLINTDRAFFLISKNIPSPMGAFLSGFENEFEVKNTQKEYGGEIYKWDDLKRILDKQATYLTEQQPAN